MRRLLLIGAVAVVAVAGSSGATTAATSSCANSFPNDGHPGPWRTTNNGGTLHGNTVHIDCPNPSTHWSIQYRVQGSPPGTGAWANVIVDDRSGNGSPPDFSVSESPMSCSTAVYRTHIVNVVTGGTINKPSGGGGVGLAC